ncbi:MAG: C39 family peptidase [Smithellaceae bacterium]|nr:C39 family peptidase [Smithellaceae bacterium]
MKGLLLALVVLSFSGTAFEIAGVPFVKQEGNLCGPAALSSVLSYNGVQVGQREIAAATYNSSLSGVLVTDLKSFAERRGFTAELAQGDQEELKSLISAGRPVIVLVDRGFWVVSRPHYLVVYGYNDYGFICHGGDRPSLQYSYGAFNKLWEKMGKVYLVVFPARYLFSS